MSCTAEHCGHLPLECVEIILGYVNVHVHAQVVGLTTRVKRRFVKENQIEAYLKLTPANYHSITDSTIANYLNLTTAPIAPYLMPLCSFTTRSRWFFNNCIPTHVRVASLNCPLPTLETFLCKQFLWYDLMRRVIKHEEQMKRCVSASQVHIIIDGGDDDEMLFNLDNTCITDCDINDIHRCPESHLVVYFDCDIAITLIVYCFSTIYRVVY